MASLNREEPDCWVMLGVASLKGSDLHLSTAAFRRAVDLGSPQKKTLEHYIEAIHEHQLKARAQRLTATAPLALLGAVATFALLLLFLLGRKLRRMRHRARQRAAGRVA